MEVRESIPRDILRLIVWFPLRWIILASPVSVGIAIMRLLGDLHYALSGGGKELLGKNLARMRGVSIDRGKAVREYFRNHYIDRLLIFVFPRLDAGRVKRLVDIEGIENLDNALKGGRGVVLVHGHFGPVHLPLVALARLGYRMKQIGLPSDSGLSWIGRNVAFRLRLRYESMMPAEIIMADSFLRKAFKWLNGNGVIMITGDGSGTETRVGRHKAFEFLGHRVMFPVGPSLLAEKNGSALIPVFIVPGEKKPYKIIIERPITSKLEGEERAEDATRRFVARLERYVSMHPGYMHFLDRYTPGMLILDK
ncbi:MAG: lysophospholipid acyltransferase family protein [Deltaproteobacteria bacterium]|nr:lysophospholipid acyltransferase family protein [Deltaproteobacteria bacterium]